MIPGSQMICYCYYQDGATVRFGATYHWYDFVLPILKHLIIFTIRRFDHSQEKRYLEYLLESLHFSVQADIGTKVVIQWNSAKPSLLYK